MAGGIENGDYSNFKAQNANMFTINSSKFSKPGKHGSLSPKLREKVEGKDRESPPSKNSGSRLRKYHSNTSHQLSSNHRKHKSQSPLVEKKSIKTDIQMKTHD